MSTKPMTLVLTGAGEEGGGQLFELSGGCDSAGPSGRGLRLCISDEFPGNVRPGIAVYEGLSFFKLAAMSKFLF